MSNLRIYTGGLMRCCILSIEEYAGPEEEDTTIPCNYHKEPKPTAVIKDGAWHWVGLTKEED